MINKYSNQLFEFFFSVIGFIFKGWGSASGGFKST